MNDAANGRRGALPPGVSRSPELSERLREGDYLADEGLSTAVFLALKLGRPLFLEGEAGVGKTEVAKVLSRVLDTPLIRLQCYEGIDVNQAVYEWDYARQLLHIRTAEALGTTGNRARFEDELYTRQFLVSRPLLAALEHQGPMPPVLLIDEIDRADDEFEAFLLEILSEFAITIPELGTIKADRPPVAVLTSNRTREVHDALKRRCLYFYIDHPGLEREVEIVRLRVPGAEELLARQVAQAVQNLRNLDLYKPPGIAETLDWTEALVALGARELDEDLISATLGSVLKYREDQQRTMGMALSLLAGGAVPPETAPPPLLDAAVTFGRVLRQMGLPAGPDRVVEFVRAVEELDVTRREDVYWAGRITMCSNPDHLGLYDRAFRLFWDGEEPPRIVPPPKSRFSVSAAEDSVQPPKKTVEKNEKGEEAVRLRYSPVDVLRKKDFADCTPEEFAELYRLMADLDLSGDLRKSRRLGPAPRGRRDARRTLRDALRTGGEPLRHRYRKARDQPRRVVLLCDVSGSMASYSRALLRFMHASVVSGEPVEAFVLGTRLTRVTRELADRDPDRALGEASRAVEDWSGGTRLGDTIKEFVNSWGQRGMARGAVVVILSDGWDRGDVGVLSEQMSRIARLAHRVVWVNPLKAAPGYQPLARGMAAALPHVDVFLSGHNLESLEELARAISGVSKSER